MDTVTSKDGTRIAYERVGSGPPVIVVDGALCSRAFGPSRGLAELLAPRFTVFIYDRRGRGDSGDTRPSAVAREVEDLAALVDAAGGHAALVGFSSGAALALEAAASGLPLTRVVAYEPPFQTDADRDPHAAGFLPELQRLVDDGRRGDAVRHFLRDMVKVPAPVVWMMTLMWPLWRKMRAAAPSLPHDAAVLGDFRVPAERLAQIRVPTLVSHGSKTQPRLQRSAPEVAKAIPGAQHRVLEGQTHNVALGVIAPVITAFLMESP